MADVTEIKKGDVEIEFSDSGFILTSPNGTKYRITVDNDGTLQTDEV